MVVRVIADIHGDIRYTHTCVHVCVCIRWNETGAGARERRDSGRQDGRQRRHGGDTAGPGDARGRHPLAARGLDFGCRAPGRAAGLGAGVVQLHEGEPL